MSLFSFPVPLIEEAVFSLLYIPASFVKDKVPIGACIYIWDLYLEIYIWDLYPLIYVSVFVQCNTVLITVALQVLSEVRKVDSPSLFFFFKIALAI